MRVLILHSRYLSGSLSGENRVVDEEAELLQKGGHEVHILAPSPDEFPSRDLAARTLFSAGVAAEVGRRVRADRIEIVHGHNLSPTLGTGVLPAASRAGAAVVITLHNYRLMCIAATFFRDGAVCEDCLNRLPLPGIVHACYRDSRAQSAVVGASLALARARKRFGSVNRFLAVSGFIRSKHVEAGFPAERILVKPNVVPDQIQRAGPGDYFLVLSRLAVEKGISELVRAWAPELGELWIAGDGPERAEIEGLAHGRGVRLVGSVTPAEIPALLAGARALFLPSVWYEGQPRVVLEAYAAGVPVIASRIGSLPDLVDENETGLTVAAEDHEGWRDAARLLRRNDVSIRLGKKAHARWKAEFSPERGLALIEAAYHEALEERARSTG